MNIRYPLYEGVYRILTDGLGLAWNGKPSHSPALFYTCAPCGSLLRCKVTVIYNAVK